MTQGQRHRRLHVIMASGHGNKWRETVGWEMDRPVALRRTDLDNKELKFKDRVFKR